MHSVRAVSLIVLLLAAGSAQAQGSGNIVCWKDKAGKTVGCGDKVPPEFQDNATRELNRRGVTIKQTDASLTAEQKKAKQAEIDRKQAEAQAAAEQRRKDKALRDTFTTVDEIDLKRTRDVQLIESNIEVQQTNLKNANDRQADASYRMEGFKKENKPVPESLQEDYNRAAATKTKIQAQIVQKRKEIIDLNQQYDEMKKRFIELTGTAPAPATAPGASPAAPPIPAAGTAPAKK